MAPRDAQNTICVYIRGTLMSQQHIQANLKATEIRSGPNFMALLTVSTESALTEAGNYVLTASVFHGLAANLGFCACVLHVTRHSIRLQG